MTTEPFYNWITQREHLKIMLALERVQDQLIGHPIPVEFREVLAEAAYMLGRYRRECDHHIEKRREAGDIIDNKLAEISRRLDEQ